MGVIGADHTSFTVRDMDKSLAFYRDLLGFQVISERPQITNNYFRKIVGMPDGVIRGVTLRIPGTDHVLELFQYLHPVGTPQDVKPNNPGSSHICYLVDDLQALYAKLKANDAQFISEPIYMDEGPNKGGWALYMRDPNGIVIELFQKAQGR